MKTWYKGQNNVSINLKKDIGYDTVTFTIDSEGEVCFYINNSCERRNRDSVSNIKITKYILGLWNNLKNDVGTVYCRPYNDGDVDRDKIYRKLGFKPVLDKEGVQRLAWAVADDPYVQWLRDTKEYCNHNGLDYVIDKWEIKLDDDWLECRDGAVYLIIDYTITDPDLPEDEGDKESEIIYLFNIKDDLIDLARDHNYLSENSIELNSVLVYQS